MLPRQDVGVARVPTTEELLADASWLRRLALRLANDRDDADDLVQDTWIAAWQSAPDAARPLRPWLTKVVRDIARMRRRTERRRASRESTIEPTVGASPDELLAQLRLHRLLTDLVLELEEPFRSTILVRFVEGRSAVEIARSAGIPDSTVRWRLREGLGRLRAQLDARAEGRKAWAPGVLAFAQEGMNMAKPTKSLTTIIVLLLALLGGIAVFGIVVSRHRSDEPPRNVAPADRASLARGPADKAPVAIPGFRIQAGVAQRRVAGQVVSGTGAPVGDAVVRLAIDGPVGLLEPVAVVKTGADGKFDFGLQPAATLNVSAEAARHSAAGVSIAVADPNAHPDQLVIQLGDCVVRLYGAVVDASGGPISGARLRSAGLAGTDSDERGQYSLCISNNLFVHVEADGYGALAMPMRVFSELRYDFVLVPEAVLVGQVITESRKPVANAHVIATPDRTERQHNLASGWAITNAEGQFRINRLAPGRFRLAATADGLATSTPVDAFARAAATHELTIIVKSVARVRGHVMMAGKPIAGASVAAIQGERDGATSYSQSDGSFALNDVPFGSVGFVAVPYEVNSPKTFAIAKAEVDDVVLEVAKRGSIHGHVTRHGKPLAGADVTCRQAAADVKTDAAGAYVLEGLPAGEIQVGASHSDAKAFSMGSHVTLAAGEDATVDIELDHAGEAIGTVVDEHGAPVAAVYVRMVLADGTDDIGESMTDANGRFDCTNMAGGEYVAAVYPSPSAGQAFAPATGDKLPTTRVPQDGAVTGIQLAIVYERLAIRGTVSDDAGAPLPDVHVEAIGRGRGGGNGWPSTMSDANGHFELASLARGVYTLRAHAFDGGDAELQGVASGTHDASITIPRPGAIEGTLAGFSSTPVVQTARFAAPVSPSVQPAGAAASLHNTVSTAIVEGDHFYQLGLAPGRYGVEAHAGAEVDGTAVDVHAGETVHVALKGRGLGKIEGHVAEFGTKKPLPGMQCAANLSNDGQMSGIGPTDASQASVSDASGHFAMSAPLGRVRVFCFAPRSPGPEAPGSPQLSVAGTDVDVTGQAVASVEVFSVRGTFGATPSTAGFQFRPLALPLVVAQVDPRVAQLGLRIGDRVMTIDGIALQGVMSQGAMFLVFNHRAGTTVSIGVDRGGTLAKFDIPVLAGTE
jgi:RNA polymerase sigma factor (sigma-70 family)